MANLISEWKRKQVDMQRQMEIIDSREDEETMNEKSLDEMFMDSERFLNE